MKTLAAILGALLVCSSALFGQLAEQLLASPLASPFGQLRTASPAAIFATDFEYTVQAFTWQTITNAGPETVTHLPAEAAVLLTLPTNATARIQRRTYDYIRTQPGKSQVVLLAAVAGDAKAGVRKRIGQFDDADGFYFEQDATNWWVVVRSSATGTTNETRVSRSAWTAWGLPANVDLAKATLFGIAYQGFGAGRVTFFVSFAGYPYPVWQIDSAGALTNVHTRTANLPLTYEIANTAMTASATTMKQLNSSVETEGGTPEPRGFPRSVGTAVAGVSVAYRRALVGIRPTFAIGTRTNRSRITLRGVHVSATSAPARIELVYKPTSVGNAAWTNSLGTILYDLSGTNITGGTVIDAWQVPSGAGVSRSGIITDPSKIPLTLDYAGLNPAELYLVATPISGTPVVTADISWAEEY